ncbi:hypothetical protein LXL04_023920 [Taraxacum kok-saghyz]
MSMAPNTQNRLYMEAIPLDISVVSAIKDGQIIPPIHHEDCESILYYESVAFRVTDGALLIIDSMEGVGLQTQSLISQTFRERVVPVLIINKIDDCFFELQIDGEKAYKSFQRVIQKVNENIVSRQDPFLGDVKVHPERGDVAFSSGLYGWLLL